MEAQAIHDVSVIHSIWSAWHELDTTSSHLMMLTGNGVNGENIMHMGVRFPGSRDTRRLPKSGPGHNNPINRSTGWKNLTFSFGPWKLEVGRADYPGPEAVKVEVHSPVRNGPRLVSNPEERDNWPEHRLSLRGTTRRDRTATSVRGGSRKTDRIDPATVNFWEALDLTEQEALRSVASCETFAADERIMLEGSPANFVIVILEGRVMISIDENGWERVLAERGPGELVGERGGLQVRVRSASVITIERARTLVVTTENFSAFLETYPWVLDIVESQLYNRLTQDQAAFRGYRPRLRSLSGQNCTVLLTDIVDFSSPARTDEDCHVIRNALYGMTNVMLQGIAEAWSESRGDGMLTVASPDIPTAYVIDRLLTELLPALERHNSTHSGPACFQLRAAIGVGPLISDDMGPSGAAITTIARLLEAPLFKQVMDTSGASLGLIATTFVYETVIRHDRSLSGYCQVQVDVKKFTESAWMSVFGTPVSPRSDPYAAAA